MDSNHRLPPQTPATYSSITLPAFTNEKPSEMAHQPPSSGEPVAVPDVLISEETIHYLGYKEDVAARLWNHWAVWTPSHATRRICDDIPGIPFIDFVTDYLCTGGVDTGEEEDEEWYACFEACGIRAEIRDTIMNPVFRDIRLTETCVSWIKYTMEMRYYSLKRFLKARATAEATSQDVGAWQIFGFSHTELDS